MDNRRKEHSNSMTDLSRQLGKLPPQAVELEESVLGAIMLEREAMYDVVDMLIPEMFYKESNSLIYEACLWLYKKSDPIDIKTVVHALRKNGNLEKVGSAYYVSELTTKVNSSANMEYHARILIEMYKKRMFISLTSEVQHLAYDEATDVFDIESKIENAVLNLSDVGIKNIPRQLSKIAPESIEETERRKKLKEEQGTTGVPSGINALDSVTGGFQLSDLIIIAARPGMGKTSFVLSIIRNVGLRFRTPIAIFSLEMDAYQLTTRLASMEGDIYHEKIKNATYSDVEWNKYIQSMGRLSDAPIFIDDTAALSILEIRSKARRLIAQQGVKMIIVDYLQLMTGDKVSNSRNREQEIASISRGLKVLAKETNVPVIALSQLSRAVETRGGDKMPILGDLRESGSIEQDADMVMFLYRPEYYGITQDGDGYSTKGTGIINIAKHRNGDLTKVSAKFIGWKMEWSELAKPSDIPGSKVIEKGDETVASISSSTLPFNDDDSDEDMPF